MIANADVRARRWARLVQRFETQDRLVERIREIEHQVRKIRPGKIRSLDDFDGLGIVYEKLGGRYEPDEYFDAWVFTVLRNAFVDAYRKEHAGRFEVRSNLDTSRPTGDSLALRLEIDDWVLSLPIVDRLVFVISELEPFLAARPLSRITAFLCDDGGQPYDLSPEMSSGPRDRNRLAARRAGMTQRAAELVWNRVRADFSEAFE